MKILVIGCGLSGSVVSRELANNGHNIEVIDIRDHVGGNIYDYVNDKGIRIHKYGPHIFHTNNKKVIDYVKIYSQWIEYKHKVKCQLDDGRLLTIPINKETSEIVGKQNVKINMGKVKFDWKEIPLSQKMNTEKIDIDLLKQEYGYGFCLNIGNPHIIFFVKDSLKVNIRELGPKIENYKYFPERVNVTFAQILDKKNIKVNVWERGAGQTKACGTAACATGVAASTKGLADKNLNIHFKEGTLKINCYDEIFMTGPVSEVKKIELDV